MFIQIKNRKGQIDKYELFVAVLPSGGMGCLFKKNGRNKIYQPPNIYWGYEETKNWLTKEKI